MYKADLRRQMSASNNRVGYLQWSNDDGRYGCSLHYAVRAGLASIGMKPKWIPSLTNINQLSHDKRNWRYVLVNDPSSVLLNCHLKIFHQFGGDARLWSTTDNLVRLSHQNSPAASEKWRMKSSDMACGTKRRGSSCCKITLIFIFLN